VFFPIEQALSQRVQGIKDSRVRVTQSEATALNAKELQRFESLAKAIKNRKNVKSADKVFKKKSLNP